MIAHDDIGKTLDYKFYGKGGQALIGKKMLTCCGLWIPACEDDPRYVKGLWRWDREDDRPTCPECVQANPYAYPGMHLVVVGGLGIPSIVRVGPDESWIGVWGFARGRIVRADGKTVKHVLQEGDVFDDIGMEFRLGELVASGPDGTLTEP